MSVKAQYLYGLDIDTKTWNNLLYIEVLGLKLILAQERIKALQQAHYLWRDTINITKCVEAIKHNKMLLEEAGCQIK